MIKISEEDSRIIKKNLGDRVSKIVIQAAYTVLDISNDFPSRHVIHSLVPAVNALIELAKDESFEGFEPELRILNCLTEAEAILRSTRQRVAGMPVTREFSRLPFELPPPCVHIFHETCEYIVESFLKAFDDKKFNIFYPFVTVDTVDSPKNSLFSIKMPEHKLYSSSVYIALSHESLHAFFKKNNKDIYDSEVVNEFIKDGYLISQTTNQRYRTEIVEEIIVEILDFEFSYLGNMGNYIKDLSTFFAEFLKESIKGSITISDIAIYAFRTFIVSVWDYIKNQPFYSGIVKPSDVADVPSELRILLRNHIDRFKKELSKHHEEIVDLLLDNLVIEFQRDFENISSLLNHIFKYVSDILDIEKGCLDELRKEIKGSFYKDLADDILEGRVCNKEIKYPHLLALEVYRHVREKGLDGIKEKPATVALILSVWNSKNIKMK